MEKRMLIAFIPDTKIFKNISKIRKIAGIKVNKNSGLKTPHITIIDNSFSDLKKVDKELAKITKKFKPFKTKITLSSFKVKSSKKIEKYKQNNSLIYLFNKNLEMNKIRNIFIKKLDYLKTEDRIKQWIKENPDLSKQSLENIKKYGTPFSLKEWKFHTTIGLIPKEN